MQFEGQFEGIYPPVITPYLDSGDVDKEGFLKCLEFMMDVGVHGVIVGGTTGEYYAQSKEERLLLVELAKSVMKNRLPLIVGVGALTTKESIEYAVAAKSLGADAILMNAPPYSLPTQAELAHHAMAIDQAVDLPIMLYNYPGRTGTMMEGEFFDLIAGRKNFSAIKESSGDINQMHFLARGCPNLTLLCGMDDQALEFFVWGARGWVCAGGNCLPKEHIALYEACVLEQDFIKGRKIMSALMPFMQILEQSGKFVQSIRYACELQGLSTGTVRAPLLGLNDAQKQEIEDVLSILKGAMQKIAS